jgi:peptidoglycan/LPS O-acetylase OafA/YrhL
MGPVANCPSSGAKPDNPSHASSDTSMNRHIDFLDPLRGIAILLVFAYHSLGVAYGRDQLPWGHWFRSFNAPHSFLLLLPATFGWAGVAIFFVISGFCIHLSFSRSPQWSLFFWRRFFRIYPVYLVSLLFFAFAFPPTRLHSLSWPSLDPLVSHLFLFHNLGKWIYAINSSYWSIALEVQLYAIYPILIALTTRIGWGRSLVAIAVIEIALRLALGASWIVGGKGIPNYLGASPLVYWFSWALGAYVAERYIRGAIRAIPNYSLYAIGVAALACSFFKPLYFMSFLLFALLTAGVMTTCLHTGKLQFPLPAALRTHLQNVGIWSYSLYLWHQPIVAAVPRLVSKIAPGVHIHPLLMFVFCISLWILVVPMAWLSYKFCELPSIALGKLFYARKSQEIRTTNRPLAAVSE